MTDETNPSTAPGADITPERPVVVLGAGPAGLTAGYLLAKQGKPVIVLESTDQVGGIARTQVRDGYRFDLGGHRFFTKVKEVDDLWHEIMKEEFLKRPRKSRIYWNDKFLEYPLQGMDVIKKLGPVELSRCLISYAWAAVKPKGREDTFEAVGLQPLRQAAVPALLQDLHREAVGRPGHRDPGRVGRPADQGPVVLLRRQGRVLRQRGQQDQVADLRVQLPALRPGQMWEQMTADIREQGGEVRLNAPVTRLRVANGRVTEVVAGGETLHPSYVISSLPLRTTVGITEPEAPLEVRDAARGLRYREFLTVLLVIDVDDLFDDNWIYIHQPGVRVLRIQNFKSWSPWMVPEGETASSIGMEYFCFEGDDLWNMADDDLVAMAGREIEKLHLAQASKVRFGFVERVHKAYPIYDELYGERVKTIRGWLAGIGNLTQVGRNGLHRYNNSDHSMLTAMRAVDNILLGTQHDIWAVNAESVYHEEHQENEDPYRRSPSTPAMEQPLASDR